MTAMTQISEQELQWFAVRIKSRQVGGIRSVTVGGDFEAYRDRQGRVRKRRVDGTGTRVFLPEHLLRRSGFEVFLPVKKRLRRKSRFCPGTKLVSQPLLADWVFVGWPVGQHRWHELMRMEVVTGIMGTGGRPVEIPSSRMARLMRQWGGGHLSPRCHQIAKSDVTFAKGDVFKVPDGPLADFDFEVVDVKQDSVRGIVNIFGRDTPLEIPLPKDRCNGGLAGALLPGDADAGTVFDAGLSACICGYRMAHVSVKKGGYCVACGNCGRRAAVGSATEGAARTRWNDWLSPKC